MIDKKTGLFYDNHPAKDSFISFYLMKFLRGYELYEIPKIISTIDEEKDRENLAVYHLFGHFDMLCINDFKLLYDNIIAYDHSNLDVSKISCTNSYLGITFNTGIDNLNVDNTDNPFVCFTQFKLNCYYLFSDQNNYLNLILDEIKSILDRNNSVGIINYSFSAYELTLCQFSNSFESLSNVIKEIRSIELDLETYPEVNILYKDLNTNLSIEKKRHFISDSISHYGIKLVRNNEGKFGYVDLKKLMVKERNYLFYVDLKLKPGHVREVVNFFRKHYPKYVPESHRFVSGRHDLELEEVRAEDFPEMFDMLRDLKNNHNIYHAIREMTTRLVFQNPSDTNENYTFGNGVYPHVQALSFDEEIVTEMLNYYKENHSNNLFLRVSKMFAVYNAGIHNSLTFNVFMDFYFYLKYFLEKYATLDIRVINEFINYFEKSYFIRHFHEFHHEEGSEVFLGYNFSLQGLVSDIDSIFKCVTFELKDIISIWDEDFGYEDNWVLDKNEEHFITYLEDDKPVANGLAANFSISCVFNLEIFFNFLLKEAAVAISQSLFSAPIFRVEKEENIFNLYFKINDILDVFDSIEKDASLNIKIRQIFKNLNETYYIEDYLRYSTIFESNLENFIKIQILCVQQAWLDESSIEGRKEKRTTAELIRWIFIAKADSIKNTSKFEENIALIRQLSQELGFSYNEEEVGLIKSFWDKYFELKTKVNPEKFINFFEKISIIDIDEYPFISVIKSHLQIMLDFNNDIVLEAHQKGGLIISNMKKYNELVIKTIFNLSNRISDFKKKQLLTLYSKSDN